MDLPQEPVELPRIPEPGELQDPHEFDQLPFEVTSADPPVAVVQRVVSGDGPVLVADAKPAEVIPRTGAAESSTWWVDAVEILGALAVAVSVVVVAVVLVRSGWLWARSRRGVLGAGMMVVAAMATLAGVGGTGAGSSSASFGAETFYGKSGERLLDTRNTGGIIAVGSTRSVNAGHGARALAVNITALGSAGNGHLRVFPCGSTPPGTSVVNYQAGVKITNAVVVRPNAAGDLCIRAYGSAVHALVDYTGSVAPARWENANTRIFNGTATARNAVTLSGFPAGAGVSLNFTIAGPPANGHIRVYPCSSGVPPTSAGNYFTGQNIAAGQVVEADGSGQVCVYSTQTVSLKVDHFGTILDQHGDTDFIQPIRVLDSRGWSTPYRTNFVLPVSAANAAYHTYVLNVTVVDPLGNGNLKVYPCDAGNYTSAVLNFVAGKNIAHSTIAIPDVDGQICFKASSSTKLIVDQYGHMNTTGIMVQFSPNSFTYTGGNSYGLGTTSAGFVETVVTGNSPELDAGYVTSLGSAPPGSTTSPVWLGGHNSTHGSPFGHIDNIANGATVRVRWATTTYARTIQNRYLAAVGSPGPQGHTFFLQTSAPSPNVWLIHN